MYVVCICLACKYVLARVKDMGFAYGICAEVHVNAWVVNV